MKRKRLFAENTNLYDKASVLEHIFNCIPAVILINDYNSDSHEPVGQNTWSNYYASDFFGYSHDEIKQIGPNFLASVIHPEDCSLLQDTISVFRSNDTEAPSFNCHIRILHNNGQYRRVNCTTMAFKTMPDDPPRQLIIILAEISGSQAVNPQNGNPLAEHHFGAKEKFEELSKREKEILRLISQGFSDESIGLKLFISRNTAHTHRNRILKKTGLKNTASLVAFAVRYGLSYCLNYLLFDLCFQNDWFCLGGI